jgi:hypothetical protein
MVPEVELKRGSAGPGVAVEGVVAQYTTESIELKMPLCIASSTALRLV